MIYVRKLAGAFSALGVLGVFLIGVPVGLCRYVGWPLPHMVPTAQQLHDFFTQNGLPDYVLIDALAIMLWLLWAAFMLSVISETLVAIRGGSGRHLIGGPVQLVAASLVAALIISLPSGMRSPGGAGGLTAVSLAQPIGGMQLAVVTGPVQSAPVQTQAPAAPATATGPAYTVVRHDSLWAISERHLGNPKRWQEIFDLNEGQVQPDGRRLTDANRIYPGWKLTLPADAVVDTSPTPLVAPVSEGTHSVAGTQSIVQPPTSTSTHSDTADAGGGASGGVTRATPTTTAPEQHADENAGVADDAKEHHAATAGPAVVSGATGGVVLTSGGIVGVTLASGIGAALVTARLRRRRLFVPARPTNDIVVSDPLEPELVQRLRRVDLAYKAENPEPDDTFPARQFLPGVVALGVNGDIEMTCDVTALGGCSIRGEQAEPLVRAMAVGFISNLGPLDAEVTIIGREFAASLIGDIEAFPGLRIEDDLAAVLTQAEVDTIARKRYLVDDDYADIAAFRQAVPIEVVPAKLIITDTTDEALLSRATAVAQGGKTLGLGVLLVNHDAACVITIDDGVFGNESVGEMVPGLVGSKAFGLRVDEATQLLRTLRASRLDDEAVRAVPETVPFDVPVRDQSVPADVPEEPMATAPAQSAESQPESDDGGPVVENRIDKLVQLSLFGPFRAVISGVEPKKGLRNQAREILTFLALHPRGATGETAGLALWPDLDGRRTNERIRNLCGSINTELRGLAGVEKVDFIERVNGRYRLSAELVGSDLWDFGAHLDAATGDDTVAHLKAAVDLYSGNLAHGEDWPWVGMYQEDLARKALSVMVGVAEELQATGASEQACAVLDAAIDLDPCGEEVHRRSMAINGSLGHSDTVLRVYKRLERRLNNDLGRDPSDETIDLLEELTRTSRD